MPLILVPASVGASLRVDLRDCSSPEVAVQDYCIELFDLETNARVARFCSEDGLITQLFTDLKPGRFQARAVAKTVGQPVYYRPFSPFPDAMIDLVAGREATLRMCVDLGGRLAVRIRGETDAAEDPQVQARVEVVNDSDHKATKLAFRTPDATGVKVDASLGFTERTTETVLARGTYTLTATADGFWPASQTVVVVPGETTRVTVVLRKQ